ncbi:MAG: hypothetical protein R3248_00540 [Candidatus Promineifilaceae bacterium]|nr:hypothetical protein [Candidatus Promineifilaceae bacterium]
MFEIADEDQIRPFTRIVAAIIVPFLVLAFLILYFFPQQSGERFAWAIQPSMTAMYMGAGYIGGAWLFIRALFGKRWHRVAPGFLPVTTFASAMLLATIFHWDVFEPSHFPFILWMGLYVVTPFLVPLVWWLNRPADPGTPEESDVVVPRWARWSLRGLGVILLGFALVGFVRPNFLIEIWTWTLSPLTARIMSGWLGLMGVGGIVISADTRWSAWKVGLQSIGSWHLLVVVAAFLRRGDFLNGLGNWYLASVIVVLVGMFLLYLIMESRRRGWGSSIG